ncbi:MAG: cupin domain-containing protein [Anaerolineae bacterium]
MPVFRSGAGLVPAWSELEFFEIVELLPGQTLAFERRSAKEQLVVTSGHCRIACTDDSVEAGEGTVLEVSAPDDTFFIYEVPTETVVVRMCGHWEELTGDTGVFRVAAAEQPGNPGDPAPYQRNTAFDNHYHDCDAYWIIVEGHGVATSEGERYPVGPGDCVATRRGEHHDFPLVEEPITAVYLETTLYGQRRLGRLWEHRDGPAQPRVQPQANSY